MPITIAKIDSDGNPDSVTVDVRPYNVVRQNKFAVKARLNILISLGLDAIHFDLMFRVKLDELASDGLTKVIDYLSTLTETIEITASDIDVVPTGTYYVETCDIKRDTNRINVYDVRLSLFYQQG